MSISNSKVEGNLQVGKACKLLGNYDVKGNVSVDEKTEIFGTVKATGNIFVGTKVKIHGNITSNATVNITEHVEIIGSVSAEEILLSKTASIQGSLHAKKGLSFVDASKEQATEKIKRFENDIDVVDEVKELLE
jgi:predicted acyltransferase (DUF342 family)